MNKKFTFAHEIGGFDDHIRKSIRGYEHLLDDVVNLSQYFVDAQTNVIDIGCSTGNLLGSIILKNQVNATYVGIEIEEAFQKDLTERRNKIIHEQPGCDMQTVNDDVRNYQFANCSLVTSLFTLQFMPTKDRYSVIKNIYDGLNKGGAFIFSEKIMCSDPRFQEMFTFNFYDYKSNKFSADEILDKERKLRNMLKPNEWHEINQMLQRAGFTKIQQFWMNHVFVGAIAIKI
jgi:tRNA (cmo5U34)-methyltransferase